MFKTFTKRHAARVFALGLVMLCSWTVAMAQLPMTRSVFNGTYVPISVAGGASTSTVSTDDGVQGSVPIGFTFNYLGTDYTSVAISGNGWISFNSTTTSGSWQTQEMFTTAGPNNALFPWFEDLNIMVTSILGTPPTILYQVQGTPGSQTFTVQWTNFCAYRTNNGSAINFQVILHEGTNVIEFMYGTRTVGNLLTDQSASIGIEGPTGGPGNYLHAITGSSRVGHYYLSEHQWPKVSFRFTPGTPSVLPGGTYTVGVGQTYPNLTEAIADINQRGISGPVVFDLTDAAYDTSLANGSNFFPILLGPVTGTSASNTITITKTGSPATLRWGGNYTGATGAMINGTATTFNGSNVEPIFALVGTDYTTVNNISIVGNTGFKNSDIAIGVYNSTATDGATNNTFTNISILMNRANTGTKGIVQNTITTATSAAGANSNNKFMNLDIRSVFSGININGTSGFADLNTEIGTTACGTFNTIGDPATPNDIGNGGSQTWGIRATNQNGIKIYNNSIRNITANAAIVDGIFLENFQGTSQIYNNKIQTLRNSSTTSAASFVSGIKASHTTTGTHVARIYNNAVSEIISSYTGTPSATRTLKGIYIIGTGGNTSQSYEIYNNSVSIDGSGSPNLSSVCFEIAATNGPVYKLGNNIFANFTTAQTGVARHMCLFSNTANSFGNTGTNSNNNNLYVANDLGTTGFTGIGNTTTYTNVANWTVGMTTTPGMESASLSLDPAFVSITGDLHSNAGGLNNQGATPQPYVTNDLDCDPRTDNDMGAYNNIVPVCTGTPPAGSITGVSAICAGLGTTLSLTGASTDAGITYQWQSSTSPGGPYTNLGTSSSQATGPLSTTTYYVVTTTCTFSSMSANTTEYTLTVNPLPVVDVTPVNPTICVPGGTAVTLTATGASTYAWSPALGLTATTGSSVDALPTGTTTYIVTGTDVNGCVSSASTTVSRVLFPAISSVTATPSNICVNGNSQLDATASLNNTAATYAFSTSTGAALNPMVGATTVIGSSVDDNVMTTPASIGFNFVFEGNTYSEFSASPDGWMKLGNIAATDDFSNDISENTNIPKISPFWDDLATGTDGSVKTLLTGTAPNRIFIVQWFVTVPRNPSGPANSTFQVWLYETSNVIEFRYGAMGVPTSGSISGGLTGITSTNYNSITFSTNTSSPVTPNNANAVAPASGRMYTFTPPGPLTYNWSPSTFIAGQETLKNPIATAVTSTTTYTVTVSNGACSVSDNVTVTAGTPLAVSGISLSSPTTCDGSNVTLTPNISGGGAPYTYIWSETTTSFSASSATVTVSPPAGTYTYNLDVSDACGNNMSSNVAVIIDPTPTVSISGTSSPYCSGANISFTGNTDIGTSFNWTGPDGFTSTLQNPTIVGAPTAATGTYSFTSTLGACTSAPATVYITVNPSPTSVVVTPTSGAICLGDSIDLLVTANDYGVLVSEDFNSTPVGWTFTNTSTGGTPANAAWTLRASPYTPGGAWFAPFTPLISNDASQFVFTNSDAQGSGSTTNTSMQTPAFSTVGYTSVTLSFYHFYRDIAAATDNAYIEVSLDGTSWTNVQVYTTTLGAVDAFVHETVNLDAFAGNPTVFVRFRYTGAWAWGWAIDNVSITGSPSIYAYDWTSVPAGFVSTDQNPLGLAPTVTTDYTVVATNSYNCSLSGSATVVVNTLPVVDALSDDPDGVVCEGDDVVLSGTGADTYVWDNGAVDGMPTIALTTTTYHVTGTDITGCSSTDSITITVNPAPMVGAASTAAGDSTCSGSTVTLMGSGADSYSWDNGVTDNVPFTATITTTYIVTGTDINGCQNTDTITIEVNPSPAVTAFSTAPGDQVCPGFSVKLNGVGADSYTWDNGVSNGVSFVPLTTNTYTVTGTDTETGCSSTASITITVINVNVGTSVSGTTITANSSTGTYQWVTCPSMVPVAGATNQTFTAIASGSYAVIVTENSCTDTSNCVTITIGIDDLNNNPGFALYPNPAHEMFTIVSATEAQVIVMDMTGKVVMDGKLIPGENKFSTGQLARGIYMVRINNNKGQLLNAQRLTVQK